MTTLIRKKLLIPIMVAVLAIVAVAYWQFRPDQGAPTATKIENSIAVISFENLTGDESQDILQRNIPDLLITNLENTGFFYVATWDRLRDLMKQVGKEKQETIDKELGFELCRREGIKALVIGTVKKVGSVFATDVKVFDVETEKLIKSTRSQGEGIDSIINTQIAELSREIALGVGITREEIASADLDISEFTTQSMDAYNYFVKGREDLYNRYANDAMNRFQKAVELDSNFALAYVYLGLAYRVIGDMNKAAENYEKARSLSETVTEKEKLMLEAEFARVEFNNEKYLEILHTIIEKYSRDKWAHLELSRYYSERDVYSEVIKHSETVLALDPSLGDTYEKLAFAYSNLGDDAKALEYLQKGSSAIPGDPNMNLSTGYFYVKMGKLDQGVRKFKDALDIKPDFNIENYIAYAYAMKEDYAETFDWINKYIAAAPSKGRKADGYLLRGYFHFWLGNSEQALDDLQKSCDLFAEMGSRAWAAEYMLGLMHVERGEFEIGRNYYQDWYDGFMESFPQTSQDWKSFGSLFLYRGLARIELKKGNIDTARSHLKEMEALMPKISSPQKLQGYDELRCEILLAEKSYNEAISALKDAKQMKMPGNLNTQPIVAYNGGATKNLLAQAYKENGDLDKAIEEYERLTDSNPENRDGRLINPINHYNLAVVYEMKGTWPKAIKSYEKFLTLGKNTDLWTAELENARKRLAALKSR